MLDPHHQTVKSITSTAISPDKVPNRRLPISTKKKQFIGPLFPQNQLLKPYRKNAPPSAVTGDAWNDFHRLKLNKKLEERGIIEKKKAERLRKRELKVQEMEI